MTNRAVIYTRVSKTQAKEGGVSLREQERLCQEMAALARKKEFPRMFVPAMDAAEASVIPEVEVIPVESLPQLVNHLSGVTPIDPFPKSKVETSSVEIEGGLQEIKGQEHAKRALEVAAAGGHNVLMVGSISWVHFGSQLKPTPVSSNME